MAFGSLIRDLRNTRELSQSRLAAELCRVSGHPTITRDEVKRWESGKVIPGPFWIEHLAAALDAPADLLASEATLARMNRRAFLSLTALTAAHGKVASEIGASIAGNDFKPLTTVQTTHQMDLVIAALLDRPSTQKLRRWMHDGDNPVLRVNSAGILAKTPGQAPADDVAKVLTHDPEMRHLYLTAVAARTCAIPWAAAEQLASGTFTDLTPKQARFLATRFATESLNDRDAGARWCSTTMLHKLSPLLSQERK